MKELEKNLKTFPDEDKNKKYYKEYLDEIEKLNENIAEIYFNEKMYSKAVEVDKKILKQNKKYHKSFLRLYHSLWALGDKESAVIYGSFILYQCDKKTKDKYYKDVIPEIEKNLHKIAREFQNKSWWSDIKISRNDDDIYTREMALKKKKENKLEEIRKKEIEEELSELTYKPKINKKSEILSKNKMPIYKRLKEIEIEKNIKMEKIKQNIGLKENNINQTNQKFNEKDFNNWLISNDNWNTKKIMKLNNIKNEVIKEQEINDEMKYQFKPKINKNSEKIFKSNYALSSIPISDRLCYGTENKEDYSKRMIKEQNMSFIPEINKDFPISDKYYDFMKRDQFQIYYENMKKNKHQKKE